MFSSRTAVITGTALFGISLFLSTPEAQAATKKHRPGQSRLAASILQVQSPSITPGGGTLTQPMQITLRSSTLGAVIYYTTNGSTPTTSSARYSLPFTLSSAATVKAIA